MSRLLEQYQKNIKTDLMTKLNLNNIHEVPKIKKIVLNMGIGEAKDDSKLVNNLMISNIKSSGLSIPNIFCFTLAILSIT